MPCLSTQAYEPGDIILSECQPFVKFLFTTSKGSRCDACFKPTPSPLQCTGCKQMFYCDEKCKLEDWENGHKLECQLGDAFSKDICQDKDSLFFQRMLRIFAVLKLKPEERQKQLPIPNGKSISFNHLVDHEQTKTTDLYTLTLLGRLKKCLEGGGHSGFDLIQLIQIDSIFYKKRIQIRATDEKEPYGIGWGLYLQTSAFDPSCKPNAFCSYEGTMMNVRAIGPIKKGESISISYYTESHMGRDERRKMLKDDYGFDCNCQR